MRSKIAYVIDMDYKKEKIYKEKVEREKCKEKSCEYCKYRELCLNIE